MENNFTDNEVIEISDIEIRDKEIEKSLSKQPKTN